MPSPHAVYRVPSDALGEGGAEVVGVAAGSPPSDAEPHPARNRAGQRRIQRDGFTGTPGNVLVPPDCDRQSADASGIRFSF
ncbi:hypothetical protein ACWD1Y_43730 [Streptomyces sp. NPDC002814]